MDIFIGGLPSTMRQRELQEIFEKYGEVTSVNIIMDHITRLNKGFGFVKMPDKDQAHSAIAALNGKQIDGKLLVVNESKFKKGEDRGQKPAKKTSKETYRKKNSDEFQNQSGNKKSPEPTKWKPKGK